MLHNFKKKSLKRLKKYYHSIKYQTHRLKHSILFGSSLATSDNVIWINPNYIKYRQFPPLVNLNGSWVRKGSWDKVIDNKQVLNSYSNRPLYNKLRKNTPCLFLIKNMEHYNSFKEHYIEGSDWRETVFWNNLIVNPQNNLEKYGGNSVKIKKRLKYNDQLFESLKNNGFVLDNGGDMDHILVGIGRQGEFIWIYGGAHRLTISQLLGFRSIPVKIVLRHYYWQMLRKEIKYNRFDLLSDTAKKFINHPDMKDVI